MSFDFGQLLITIGINTISGLIANIFYILLAIWGFKLIAKEIKELVKQIPNFINQYFKLQLQQTRITMAKEGMKRL